MKALRQKNKYKDKFAKARKWHRREFLVKLKEICNLMAGYDLFSKIPAAQLEQIYNERLHSTVMHVVDGCFTKQEKIDLSEKLKMLLLSFFVELPLQRGRAVLGHQLVEGNSLFFYLDRKKDHEFSAVKEMREALSFCWQPEYEAALNHACNQMLLMVGILMSEFNRYFIGTHLDFEKTEKNICRYVIDVDKIASVKEYFVIDGHSRPAFQVGWAFPAMEVTWMYVKLKHLPQDQPALPVFIQSHALQKLEERVGLTPGPMHFFVFQSLQSINYHIDSNGKILIDYVYIDKKIGYLLCSLEDNKLLIHTFLFITNNGTPEGRKLSALTGLQLLDKKYLAIDEFSTFLTYRIQDNEFLKNIFTEAGLGHLLDIDVKRFFLATSKTGNIETLANYLSTLNH